MKSKEAAIKVAIMVIGDELMDKQADTNSLIFTTWLQELGLEVEKKVIVPDELPLMVKTLKTLTKTYPFVLCSGGLGPTQDDLTRQAVAKVMGQPLRAHQQTLRNIEKRYKKRGYTMLASDKQQAIFPKTAILIPNLKGSAPGFLGYCNDHLIAALPGPPQESIPMLQGPLTKLLKQKMRLGKQVRKKKELSVCGVGESVLQQQLGPVFASQKNVKLGFLLQEPGETLIKLMCVADTNAQAEKVLREAVVKVKKKLGPIITDNHGRSINVVVGRLLSKNMQSVAVAESCTGGLISRRITAVPGSSDYFVEGAVTYSNEAKNRRLGVPLALIKKHGAVSEVVAKKMAQGIKRTSRSDWGVAVTGIAGPGGGSKEKPVGLVHIAVAGPNGVLNHTTLNFPRTRDIVQRLTASIALDLLRKSILGLV